MPDATLQARRSVLLECTVNGRPVSVEVPVHLTLLDFLRDTLGLTGAKKSCEVQICGACTVLVDGNPVSACTYLAHEARGRTILTIEGLRDQDELHPIQKAFIEQGAFQCGYCTPGMIMAIKALLDSQTNPSQQEIRHFLDGNICRCTGYHSILAAVETCLSEHSGRERNTSDG